MLSAHGKSFLLKIKIKSERCKKKRIHTIFIDICFILIIFSLKWILHVGNEEFSLYHIKLQLSCNSGLNKTFMALCQKVHCSFSRKTSSPRLCPSLKFRPHWVFECDSLISTAVRSCVCGFAVPRVSSVQGQTGNDADVWAEAMCCSHAHCFTQWTSWSLVFA